MDYAKPYEIKNIYDDCILVLSTTYETPLEYASEIEACLNASEFTGTILFDLLLCNGNVYNRFAKGVFENGEIDYASIKVIDIGEIADAITEISENFYRANQSLLESSYILLDEDKRTLVCS